MDKNNKQQNCFSHCVKLSLMHHQCALASRCSRVLFIHYFHDATLPSELKRKKKAAGRQQERRAKIVKNGIARYILMQILRCISRTELFASTMHNSASVTATCLSQDACIVHPKDIQEYVKGARRGYFCELPFSSRARYSSKDVYTYKRQDMIPG